jgi:dGTP triphosphohydrolase
MCKIKGLFLDDERNPEDVTWIDYPESIEWTVVRSYDEFFYEFHRGQFQVISFDHDIQDYNHRGVELTGYTVLKAMLDTFMTTPPGLYTLPEQVFFHTQNPIGKSNMESYWNNFCKHYKED